MRALLIAAAPVEGSVTLVAELATQCDLVIAVDGGGAVCLEAGVAPDVVLGDFDSLDAAALQELSAGGSRVVRFPAHKDRTDLELAVDEARSAGASEIVLTCASSGRLDHTLAAIATLLANPDLRPRLAEPDVTGWILSLEGRPHIVLHGRGATVSLLAVSEPAVVSASGVEWPLDRFEIEPGSGLGASNVIADEAGADIAVAGGTLLVLAPCVPGTPRASEV